MIVASSTEQITRTADRVHALILLTAALATALGAAIAAALTARGLAPLRRLTVAARGIRSGCTSRTFSPYSSTYVAPTVSGGSLPGRRAGTNPAPGRRLS